MWEVNNVVPWGGYHTLVPLCISQYQLLAGHSGYPFFHSTNLSACHVLATVLGPGDALVTEAWLPAGMHNQTLLLAIVIPGIFNKPLPKIPDQCLDYQQTDLPANLI